MPHLSKETAIEWKHRAMEARRLVRCLLAAGATVEEIAFRVAVSWRAVTRWRAGEAAPREDQWHALKKLAEKKQRKAA